jgi:hypothetical protein
MPVPSVTVQNMRRGYIEVHCPLADSFKLARRWAGSASTTLIAPSTRAVESSPWLERTGIPIGTVGLRHTRFQARSHGIVIAWCLDLGEVLDIEDHRDVAGVVVVRAYEDHAPWITAYGADHVGGEVVPAVPEASAAIKAMVKGLSLLPVLNQGLIDSRERSMGVQAMTYFHQHGHRLKPDQLIAEALRNEWPRQSPLELARLAEAISAGRRPRFAQRLRPDVVAEWAEAK